MAVTWSTTSDTTCSSSIAAPGSTVALGPGAHVDPHRLVGGVDGLVEERGQPGGSARPWPGVDAREQHQCLGVVAHPPGGVDQLRQGRAARAPTGRRASGRPAARCGRPAPAAAAARRRTPRPRAGRRSGRQSGRHRDRSREWPCSGARRSPSHPRSRTCRRPPSVLSSGVRQGEPAPLGRRMPGRRPPVLGCKVPGSTRKPPSHRRPAREWVRRAAGRTGCAAPVRRYEAAAGRWLAPANRGTPMVSVRERECAMGLDDKMENKAEERKGKAKEGAGRATGRPRASRPRAVPTRPPARSSRRARRSRTPPSRLREVEHVRREPDVPRDVRLAVRYRPESSLLPGSDPRRRRGQRRVIAPTNARASSSVSSTATRADGRAPAPGSRC
jgi:hypothetical protein